MKPIKQKLTQNQESQIPSLSMEAIVKLYREAGIESTDRTKENLGKTSVMFINSPSTQSQDKAETALHYHNQRKGR